MPFCSYHPTMFCNTFIKNGELNDSVIALEFFAEAMNTTGSLFSSVSLLLYSSPEVAT